MTFKELYIGDKINVYKNDKLIGIAELTSKINDILFFKDKENFQTFKIKVDLNKSVAESINCIGNKTSINID